MNTATAHNFTTFATWAEQYHSLDSEVTRLEAIHGPWEGWSGHIRTLGGKRHGAWLRMINAQSSLMVAFGLTREAFEALEARLRIGPNGLLFFVSEEKALIAA